MLRIVRNYKRGNYIHVTYIHTSTYTRTEILYIQRRIKQKTRTKGSWWNSIYERFGTRHFTKIFTHSVNYITGAFQIKQTNKRNLTKQASQLHDSCPRNSQPNHHICKGGPISEWSHPHTPKKKGSFLCYANQTTHTS